MVGAGPGRADDTQAMALWQRSVLSAFQKARAHEADIVAGNTDSVPRFPDLDALMPPQDVRTRLVGSQFAVMDTVVECRQAVLQFRWLVGDRGDVTSLYDPKIAQEVRDYVGSARRCEAKAKLPAIGSSRLREAADVISDMPEPVDPPPASLGMPLHLSSISDGKLVDVALNEVFHQLLKDGIQARTVTVFAHPGDPVQLETTAAFLARFYVAHCDLDMVRVMILRDDLPTQLAHPGTWLDVNRIAAADYDPNRRVFSTPFDVEVAKRTVTPAEVAQSEFYDVREKFHQDQGVSDPDEVDAAATRDVVAKFKLGKDWTLPSGNEIDMLEGGKVEFPEALLKDSALRDTLAPTCDRYAEPKG